MTELGSLKLSRSSSANNTDQGYHTLVSSFTSNDMPPPTRNKSSSSHGDGHSTTTTRGYGLAATCGELGMPLTSRDSNPLVAPQTMGKLKKKARKFANVFDKLTDEVILRIFSNLSANELCQSCSRVCRRWYYLTWDPYLWRSITFSDSNLNLDKGLRAVLRLLSRDAYCRHKPTYSLGDDLDHYLTTTSSKSSASRSVPLPVEVIRVDGSFTLTDRGLSLLARKCGDLRSLYMRGCPNATDAGLTELMSKCAQLERLDVTGE